MIEVTVLIDGGEASVTEAISAPSIREAVVIARARYPEQDLLAVYPIDGEAFFSREHLRAATDHLLSRGLQTFAPALIEGRLPIRGDRSTRREARGRSPRRSARGQRFPPPAGGGRRPV